MPESRLYEENSYAHYNYLRPSFISKLKRHRFEVALSLARPYFGSCAIDFGCADGVFLPSLAKYFSSVIAIDKDAQSVQKANTLILAMSLTNVTAIQSSDQALIQAPCSVLFLLEVLPYIEDQIGFVRQLLSLVEPAGAIIAAVPRMTGPLFAIKYLVQLLTGMNMSRYTFAEYVCSCVGIVPPTAIRGFKGFDERQTRESLKRNFTMRVWSELTSIFYIIRKDQ